MLSTFNCPQCVGPLGVRGQGEFFCLYCGKPFEMPKEAVPGVKPETAITAPPTVRDAEGVEHPMEKPQVLPSEAAPVVALNDEKPQAKPKQARSKAKK